MRFKTLGGVFKRLAKISLVEGLGSSRVFRIPVIWMTKSLLSGDTFTTNK